MCLEKFAIPSNSKCPTEPIVLSGLRSSKERKIQCDRIVSNMLTGQIKIHFNLV